MSALSEIVSAFQTELGRPEVAVKIGGKALAEHAAPPRIVFVPTSDTFAAPPRVGGTPRALYSRRLGAQIHIWGADFDATEQLLIDTVVTLRRITTGPSIELGAADWIGQEGELLTRGDACQLPVTITTTVFDRTPTTAKITSVEAIPKIQIP